MSTDVSQPHVPQDFVRDALAGTPPTPPFVRTLAAYYRLTKPNLTFMVAVTTLLGLYLGLTGPIPWVTMIATLLGTTLTAGGACALNMYIERQSDARMSRTRRRPIPAGTVTPRAAFVFGVGIIIAGTAILAYFANPLTAGLSVLAAASYVLVYTPLKTRTPWSTWVGAVPGALPPAMGWTAIRGTLDIEAVLIFAILFWWQLPHFWALALLYRDDYERGGFKVLPARSNVVIERHIVGSTAVLVAVSALLTVLGRSGWIYLGGALAAGGLFLYFAVTLLCTHQRKQATNVFLMSLAYLPFLIGFLVVDRLQAFLHAVMR